MTDEAYIECMDAQEAAYWEARRQKMGLDDKQIGDLLRAAAPHILKGVSGSPDETLRAALARATYIAEHLWQMVDPETWRASGGDDGQGHYEGDYRAEQTRTEIQELAALAGVGEHRPDQPQTAFCGDPYAHSAHEWIRGGSRVDCPGTWMPSAVREQEA